MPGCRLTPVGWASGLAPTICMWMATPDESKVERPTSKVERSGPKFAIDRPLLESWASDVGIWAFDVGLWTLEKGLTNAVGVRKTVAPPARVMKSTRASVWPWLASKVGGRFP